MSKTGVRIDEQDYIWIMNHRDSNLKGIADVVHKLIEFWEMCQNTE